MITLAAALSGFHIPQQGIHFRNTQLAVGAHGTMAGHSGENFIDMVSNAFGVPVLE